MSRLKSFKLAVCAACCLMGIGVAQAATQIVDTNGKLTGATGVYVGSTLYDVSFVDGSCVSLFSGCTTATSFAFQSADSALLASQALLDQVLLDTPQGSFDTIVELTAGIVLPAPFRAFLFTPFGRSLANTVDVSVAVNSQSEVDDLVVTGRAGITIDTTVSENGNAVYLIWTPTPVAAVPEPEIYAMMGIGLGLLGWVGRKKRLKEAAAA